MKKNRVIFVCLINKGIQTIKKNNNNKKQNSIRKTSFLDMFDELDDELENDDLNMMVRNNTYALYEADDDKKADPNNKKHILRLIESFEHRKHLCLIIESQDLNLRDALKVYTKGQGLDLSSIRSYAMQIFVALAHLRKHKVIHADIKLDNILIQS